MPRYSAPRVDRDPTCPFCGYVPRAALFEGDVWVCGACGDVTVVIRGTGRGFWLRSIQAHEMATLSVVEKAQIATPGTVLRGALTMRKNVKKTPLYKEKKHMLDRVLSFDVDTIEIDEMVELLTFGSACMATYEANDLEVPSRLSENLALLRTEIARKATDNRERALREIEREIEAMKSKEEKKSDLQARKDALLAKLGRKVQA